MIIVVVVDRVVVYFLLAHICLVGRMLFVAAW